MSRIEVLHAERAASITELADITKQIRSLRTRQEDDPSHGKHQALMLKRDQAQRVAIRLGELKRHIKAENVRLQLEREEVHRQKRAGKGAQP